MDNNISYHYKSNTFHRMLSIFIYIVVLLASLDIFLYYFSKYLRGISYYAVLGIAVVLVLLNFKNIKLTRLHFTQSLFYIIWVTIYIVVNQFFTNYKYSNIIMGINFNIVTIQIIEVFCVFIFYFYLDSCGYKNIKVNIIKIILFSLIIDAVVTLRALAIDSEIARIMATGIEELNVHDLKGVSGYATIYSIVIIMPMIIYSITELKTKRRIFLQFFVILMMFFIYKSAYTIALIALVLGVIIYFFLNVSNIFKVFLLLLMLFIGILLITPDFIYNILVYLSDKTEIQAIAIRLKQLAALILYGDYSGDSLYRIVLYKRSIDAFFNYPIAGITIYNSNYSLSGHSAFLDILGGTGLLGFIPYLMFLWYSFKISMKKAKNKKCKNAIKTSYIVFCLIGWVNPLVTSFKIMLFLLFFVSWYPIFVEHIKVKKNNINKKI